MLDVSTCGSTSARRQRKSSMGGLWGDLPYDLRFGHDLVAIWLAIRRCGASSRGRLDLGCDHRLVVDIFASY